MIKLQSREAQALLTATVSHLETNEGCATYRRIVLQSLASGNPEDNTLQNLLQGINNLISRTSAVLQWIPAHTGGAVVHGKFENGRPTCETTYIYTCICL